MIWKLVKIIMGIFFFPVWLASYAPIIIAVEGTPRKAIKRYWHELIMI